MSAIGYIMDVSGLQETYSAFHWHEFLVKKLMITTLNDFCQLKKLVTFYSAFYENFAAVK